MNNEGTPLEFDRAKLTDEKLAKGLERAKARVKHLEEIGADFEKIDGAKHMVELYEEAIQQCKQ